MAYAAQERRRDCDETKSPREGREALPGEGRSLALGRGGGQVNHTELAGKDVAQPPHRRLTGADYRSTIKKPPSTGSQPSGGFSWECSIMMNDLEIVVKPPLTAE